MLVYHFHHLDNIYKFVFLDGVSIKNLKTIFFIFNDLKIHLNLNLKY